MADSYVTINGLRLDVEGFCVARDLTPLMAQAPRRGENFVADGVEGATFRSRVRDQWSVLLPLVIFGDNSSASVSHSNLVAGLRANTQEIVTTCVEASDSALVNLTLTLDDASTLTANVHCPRLDVKQYGRDIWQVWSAVLEVVIPAGELT